jgi:hypothetical protein
MCLNDIWIINSYRTHFSQNSNAVQIQSSIHNRKGLKPPHTYRISTFDE